MALSVALHAPPPGVPTFAPSPVRARVLAAVRDSPGISKSDLCARLGAAWGTVAHHLHRLLRDGHIVAEARGRCVVLYAADVAPRHRPTAAVLRDGMAVEVVRLLGQVRQASLGDIGHALGVSRKVARRLVRGLVAAGLVENSAAGRPRYTLAQRDAVRPHPLALLARPAGDAARLACA